MSNLIELVAIGRRGFVWIGGHGEDVSRMSESYDCDILRLKIMVELGPTRNGFRVRIQVPKSYEIGAEYNNRFLSSIYEEGMLY